MSRPTGAPAAATCQTRRWVGYLCVVLAATLWSTSGFYAKSPVFEDWPLATRGLTLAFWRALFAAGMLVGFVRRIEWRWAMLPMVACFCLMNGLYLTSIVRVEASIAIWLQSTAPIWIFLISAAGLRERVEGRDWWMLVWAAAGVGLILVAQAGHSSWDGLLFGLVSGVMYAGVVVSLRWLRQCDPVWLVFLNHAAAAVVFFPWVLASGRLPQGAQWLYLTAFGVVQMGLPYIAMARGLRTVPGHEASLIGLLEPILLPVWVFLAWHRHPTYEPPHWTTLLGGGLILVGLALRYGRRKSSGGLKAADVPSA